MNKKNTVFILLVIGTLAGCRQTTKVTPKTPEPVTVIIQPFADVAEEEVQYVYTELHKVYPLIKVNKTIALPDNALNSMRYRYRADSLLKCLGILAKRNETMLGLTRRDISVTNGAKQDWGVMGFGSCPGNTCIASSFRLSPQRRTEQFFKVAVHELGHTNGLPHCPVKNCYMRDAEGGNTTNEETAFCARCSAFLKSRSWKL